MWTVTFSIVDGKGKQGSFSLNFDASRTIAQIEGWVTSVTLALNVIVAGGFTAISIARSMLLPLAIQTTPADDADVEEKMKTIFRSVANYVSSFAIPAIDESIVAVGSSSIDQSNPFIIAFNTAVEVGADVGGVNVRPSDNRGSPASVITSQEEVFTSSNGV